MISCAQDESMSQLGNRNLDGVPLRRRFEEISKVAFLVYQFIHSVCLAPIPETGWFTIGHLNFDSFAVSIIKALMNLISYITEEITKNVFF